MPEVLVESPAPALSVSVDPPAPALSVANDVEPEAPADDEAPEVSAEPVAELELEEPPTPVTTRRDKRIQQLLERDRETRTQLQQQAYELQQLRQQQQPADTKPRREAYEDPDMYVEAYAGWAARQQLNVAMHQLAQGQVAAAVNREAAALVQSYMSKVDAVRGKLADFDDVANAPSVPITQVMGQAIMRLDNGPEVQYYLGAHPKEAERIARMADNYQAIAELGKLSLKVAGNGKVATTAHRPAKPMSARSSSADRLTPWQRPNMSVEEYAAWRKAGGGK